MLDNSDNPRAVDESRNPCHAALRDRRLHKSSRHAERRAGIEPRERRIAPNLPPATAEGGLGQVASHGRSLTPSPTPSPLSASHRSTSWHYPAGPSFRYHVRERPQYARFHSTTTMPIGLNLSTERRAHRRTQSTAQITPVNAHGGDFSRPISQHGRGPLYRYPSSASTSTMPLSAPPLTPAKHTRDPRLQDSPFSDYFSDAHSASHAETEAAAYDAPSMETQQMLVRLNKLQAQVMRSGDDALNIVGRKLGEIESELEARHAQTRLPADMDDSGLFVDDEELPSQSESERRSNSAGSGVRSAAGPAEHTLTAENKLAEQDFALLEAQEVLESLRTAQEELRQRYTELVHSNDVHVSQIEDRQQEVEKFRSENEALRTDLGFDHSELLFMKLQMKALMVEIDEVEASANGGDRSRPSRRSARRSRFLKEADRWHMDWQDVDARFRRRRGKYGVLSGEERQRQMEEQAGEGEDSDWRLETVKKVRGQVDCITITRVTSSTHQSAFGNDGAADDEIEARHEEAGDDERVDETGSAPDHDKCAILEGEDVDPPSQPSVTEPQALLYADHSTQTEAPLQDDGSSIYTEDDDDDCAITTSPPTPKPLSPVIQPL
ncbi:hypothetical protein LTR53_007807, partial [Teratosphaeriaceae sp. CCFEE 6253]